MLTLFSTLPTPQILIKKVSQATIQPKTLAILPATLYGISKPDCHYSFMGPSVPYKSQQNLFAMPVL